MCPFCPHCSNTKYPCQDALGSVAEAMGGIVGRVDAMFGAVESQKVTGALHYHFFIFVQRLHQYATLKEIAEKLQAGLVQAFELKKTLRPPSAAKAIPTWSSSTNNVRSWKTIIQLILKERNVRTRKSQHGASTNLEDSLNSCTRTPNKRYMACQTTAMWITSSTLMNTKRNLLKCSNIFKVIVNTMFINWCVILKQARKSV